LAPVPGAVVTDGLGIGTVTETTPHA
jgi:hypothetical protein